MNFNIMYQMQETLYIVDENRKLKTTVNDVRVRHQTHADFQLRSRKTITR